MRHIHAKKSVLGLACCIAAFCGGTAQGAFEAANFASITSGGVIGLNVTVGWAFDVLSPISVTDLGYWKSRDAALTTDVGIWTDSGTLLASATVLGTDPVIGDWFKYHPITPVTLNPGRYVVAGTITNLGRIWIDGTNGLVTPPQISWVEERSQLNTNTLTMPVGNFASAWNFGNFGGTFRFEPVPAPGSAAVLGLGGLAALRRRRGTVI